MNRDLVKIRSLTPFPDALGRYTKITDGVGMRTIIRNPAADGELTTETLNTTGSDGFIELTNKTLKDVSGRVMNFESKADNLLISNQEYAYDAADGRLRGTGEGNTGVAAVYYRDENSEFVAHTVTYQGTMAEALAENPAKWRGYFGRHRDGEGRLANVQNYKVGQPITSGMHTFGYDALDRRTSEARDGGTNWEYGYNSRNEVTSASRKDDAGTALNGWQFAYSFDAIGNRYSSSGGRRTGTYTTNALNQYTAATVAGKIDVVGEVQTPDTLVWASRTVPPPNEGIQQTTETTRQGNWFHRAVPVSNTAGPVDTQILVKGIRTGQTNPTMEETGRVLLPKEAETFTYDADGNMTGDSLWIYTWDGENRLVEVVSKLPTDSGSYRKLRFKYDYANRMAKKEVSKWVGGAWVVEYRRHCIWQGWNIIGELDHLGGAPASSDTGSLRRTVWGLDLSGSLQGAGGVGGLLAVQPLVGAAQITTPVYDGNGNILAYHDLTTGVKVADFAYGPFGEPLKAYGPAAKNHPFRFSTKYTDEETGLVLYQLRPYRADLGRWLQKDRIGERGGVNLYGMVGNAPVLKIDLLGLKIGAEGGAQDILNNVTEKINAILKNKDCSCASPEDIEKSAKKFEDRLAAVWRKAYKPATDNDLKPDGKPVDSVGGHMCWDWATAFKQLADEMKNGDTSQPGICEPVYRQFSDLKHRTERPGTLNLDGSYTPNPVTDGPVHWAIKICFGNCDEVKCCINLDDSFFDGLSCVHDGDWPNRKDYTEVPPLLGPDGNPIVPPGTEVSIEP